MEFRLTNESMELLIESIVDAVESGNQKAIDDLNKVIGQFIR